MATLKGTFESATSSWAGVVASVAEALAAVDRLLAPKGVRWAVLGAHAANLYRDEVRATQDVDVLVSLSAPLMKSLADDLTAGGWHVRHRTEDGWLIRARHPQFGDIDVMCTQEEYQRTALDRAVERSVRGMGVVRFLAVEDVIIHKLIANRAQDELDVVSVLKGNPSLDAAHMERWLKEWDIEERYDELRQVSKQQPGHSVEHGHGNDRQATESQQGGRKRRR